VSPVLEYLKLFGEWIKSVRTMFVAGAVAALAVFAPERRLEAIHIYPAVERFRPLLWLVLAISAAGLLFEIGKLLLSGLSTIFIWLRIRRRLHNLAADERAVLVIYVGEQKSTWAWGISHYGPTSLAEAGILHLAPTIGTLHADTGLYYYTIKPWVLRYLTKNKELIGGAKT
jgi:hypothetical protein